MKISGIGNSPRDKNANMDTNRGTMRPQAMMMKWRRRLTAPFRACCINDAMGYYREYGRDY